MDNITINVDGLSIEGPYDKVVEILRKTGRNSNILKRYYYSSSKCEWIPYDTMNTKHIFNALLKEYRAWVQELSKLRDENPRVLLQSMSRGPDTETFKALLTEYVKRAHSHGCDCVK